MINARGDSDYIGTQPYYVYWCTLVTPATITQLTKAVVPPALDAACVSKSAGVVTACGDGGYVAAQPHHIHRRVLARCAAIAKLTIGVSPPALDPPCGSEGTGVGEARGDGGHTAAQSYYIYECTDLGSAAIAQLTIAVVSPALDAAYVGEGTGVAAACGDGGYTR